MLCLLLHLILPKGKEPFNPISLLGFHSAWQHTPASTCVCQEPSLLSESFPCCSQLTSVGEHPSHAQAHLSSHPSKMSGGDTKSAWHKHRGGSQCKRQRTLSHLSSRDERHLEWGVRGLHQQPQIQGGAWTFSCHPRLCETQAPILQDPAPQRASGQVMPCL